LAERLAERLDAVPISADAFQIYRGLDIGTAKPDDAERYRLLDIKEPHEDFGVGEWVGLACAELRSLWKERRSAILVGGTGLYCRALLEGYTALMPPPGEGLREVLRHREEVEGAKSIQEELRRLAPEVADRTDMRNPVRVKRALERVHTKGEPIRFKLPPYRRLKVRLDPPVEELNARIADRVLKMMHNGWVQEVARLRGCGVARSAPSMRAIGYGALWDHLDGRATLEESIDRIIAETRRYAKRQRTWLRKEPGAAGLPYFGDSEQAFQRALQLVALIRDRGNGEVD